MTDDEIKSAKIPDQKELEKELNEYLGKKYGDRVKLVVPMLFPRTDRDRTGRDGEGKSDKGLAQIKFDMKPEELEAYLNEYVVKQDEAKEILATKICTHFNRIKFQERSRTGGSKEVGRIKNNIIMIGPTGVGKTYLIKLIANKIGVPFVKGDATKFSETGYVGGDVEDLIRDLVHEADGDIKLAEYGIVYLDEIDKIASSNNLIGPDVSRTGVQRALLKPMEETEVDLRVPHDPVSQLEAIEQYRKTGKRGKKTVNTRNILFIMSGAFSNLEENIKRRLNREGIGFGAEVRSKDERVAYLKEVKAEDLIEYGFESEFIGRLPVTVVFDRLEVDDLYQILKNPNNPIIIGKKRDFKAYGIDVLFEDRALYRLAEKAYEEKTGARGLVSAVEKVLLKFEKKLPSTGISRFVVTPAMVDDPQGELEKVLSGGEDNDRLYERVAGEEKEAIKELIRKRQKDFLTRYGVVFGDNRIDLIASHVISRALDIQTVYEETVSITDQIHAYERRFAERHNIQIEFDEGAIDRIIELVLDESVDVSTICDQFSQHYEHGLKLIRDKTGMQEFILTREAVDEPEDFLNRLIQRTYRLLKD
ncbi:MAG: AAA family ATPase [Deltaproteobacteria bacterium]|nr:AAA family ATPase [Deltaproteobacteria bacterium]MBW2120991.1 AAA family ATPase [Deltaproteobacteria bacterium]